VSWQPCFLVFFEGALQVKCPMRINPRFRTLRGGLVKQGCGAGGVPPRPEIIDFLMDAWGALPGAWCVYSDFWFFWFPTGFQGYSYGTAYFGLRLVPVRVHPEALTARRNH